MFAQTNATFQKIKPSAHYSFDEWENRDKLNKNKKKKTKHNRKDKRDQKRSFEF